MLPGFELGERPPLDAARTEATQVISTARNCEARDDGRPITSET
jgi:hypothetical protein